MRQIVIGVAGGTGSGKTTVVQAIVRGLGVSSVTVIQHDSYYRDRGGWSPEERARVNYDHPEALETELLVEHLRLLRAGHGIEIPIYDFSTHTRAPAARLALPQPVIIVEGILILWDATLRSLFDIKLFVETPDDIRFIRRLKRDIDERGRSLASVVDQYVSTVRPMHLQFVEPSKQYADIIIPEGGYNDVAVDVLIAKIRSGLA